MKAMRMLPLVLVVLSLTACDPVTQGQEFFPSGSKDLNVKEAAVSVTGKTGRQSGRETETETEERSVPKQEKASEPQTERSMGTKPPAREATVDKPSVKEQNEQVHVHEWIPLTKTVHHEAVTTREWIEDKAAWDEQVATQVPIYEKHLVIIATCRGCGGQFTGATQDEAVKNCHRHIFDVHDNMCGYGLEDSYWEQIQTGTRTEYSMVHHDEQGHYETRIMEDGFTETKVIGYKCSECGAEK